MAKADNTQLNDMPQPAEAGYYQWLIVGSALIYCIIWSGAGYYVFSVFVKSLQKDFSWERSSIMVGFLIWSLINGVASILVGRAVDRFHAKRVMMVGSVITTLGFFSLSKIASLSGFYLSYAIVGIGIASIGQVPCSALITEWFEKRRGLAIGLMAVGVGLGGMILSPLTSGLLIPSLGWRHAYLALGVIVLVSTLPLALFIIRPATKSSAAFQHQGVESDGEGAQRNDSSSGKNPFLSSPLLWFIAIGFLFSQFGLTGTLQNQIPHMTDVGFSPIVAASVLGMIGLISSFAKIFFGWFCDVVQVRFAFMITVSLQALGTFVLLTISPDTPMTIIWLYAFAIGAGGGSWLPIMSMYISRSFPLKYYGSLMGIANFGLSVGVATGPLFAGYIFDVKGSYEIAFTAFLGCYAMAAILGFLSKSKDIFTKKSSVFQSPEQE